MQHDKSKTVFILTPWHGTNFGTVLQNYALSETIKSLGFYPTTILWEFAVFNSLGIKDDRIWAFRKKNISCTEPCFTQKELKRIISGGDRIIIGGDQVFYGLRCKKDEYRWGFRYGADFVSGYKVIASYAASVGRKKFPADKYTVDECKRLLHRFDRLAVREKSAIDILQNTFGVNGIEVLDPVFLLSPDRYQQIIDNTQNLITHDGGYIAFVMLKPGGQSVFEVDEDLKERLGGNERFLNINVDEKGQYNTVGQWLYNVKNAKLVITNSFHCTALAIIFRRPFISIEQGSMGVERLINIIENFNLHQCIKKQLNDITLDDINIKIDWDEVDRITKERLSTSLNYLKEVLSLTPTYKKPYINWWQSGLRAKYDKAYRYRKKAQEVIEYKFGFRHRVLRIIIKFLVDKKRYKKLKRDHVIFFQDSKSLVIQFLGRFYN